MTGVFGLPITCPLCAGDLHLVTTGRTTTWNTCAALQCTECGADTILRITLHCDDQRPRRTNNGGGRRILPREHGTDRGYNQHRFHNDLPACEPCRKAHSKANKGYRKRVTA